MGTSGWQYKDWRGDDRLYPPKLPQRLWLEHFAGSFASVEVNNAFYRLPERDTFANWRARTPDDFCFAVKMSRYLTHIKRLQDPAEPVARFLSRADALGDKLGPVLLQLPPTLQFDPGLLRGVLSEFPSGVRVAVEPRHDSWWVPSCRQALEARNAALSWADRKGRPVTPLWVTADWVYLRLHEGRAHPWPHYGREALATWVDRLPDLPAYVYFNNDPGGAAVTNATTMARLARRRGRDVTRTP
ncbi:DUF72 domain-containing protein [Actinoplanes sp. RD1]|uniref:DUF72 domain-containing protein n=1 Tax=Actinoplanes sp. RD1 TaxID=3064538 RepID=UPI00274263C3|nr:DUF72 domain-containing protein [Actinoplanes sp. RD1]